MIGEMARVVDRSHIVLGSGCHLSPYIEKAGALLTEILIRLVWGGVFIFDFHCCYCCSCYFKFSRWFQSQLKNYLKSFLEIWILF